MFGIFPAQDPPSLLSILVVLFIANLLLLQAFAWILGIGGGAQWQIVARLYGLVVDLFFGFLLLLLLVLAIYGPEEVAHDDQ